MNHRHNGMVVRAYTVDLARAFGHFYVSITFKGKLLPLSSTTDLNSLTLRDFDAIMAFYPKPLAYK